ncbi:MAG: hypothetical protein WCI05_10565 [Myxococcales bacterium]
MRNSSLVSLRHLVVGALFLAPLVFDRPAAAVGTRTFTLDTLERLSGGELKGVSVGADGVVRAGWTLGNVPLPDASAVFSALALADGSVLVGTSPNGKVFKVAGDVASVFSETKEIAVTSLVVDAKGNVFAATLSNKLYKLTQGKAELFATLPETEHVWALVADKKGGFFAAADGKVLRVEANGTASVYWKSDEPHIVSLVLSESGDLYAGSSGKGILYKLTGPGRVQVLYDFPGDEVKQLALGPNATLFAIVNDYGGDPPDGPRTRPSPRSQPGPTTAPRIKPGKGALYRFDAAGRPEKLMHHDEFHYLAVAVDPTGAPFVGTGAEGRVYTVDDAHAVSLVADADERQVSALAVGPKSFAVSSDPAVFHRVLQQGGPDSVWTSKVLDAGLRARFGHLSWRATGALEVSTRSGNSATADNTWSTWSAPLVLAAPIQSPPGRFIQVRARWGRDPGATLADVTVPFLTDNLRPVVTEVRASQKGVVRDAREGIVSSGTEAPKHDSTVRITWKVDNADQDSLRYRLQFRRDGQPLWRDVLRPEEVLTKTEYDWDTTALPEGKYRIRVEASDEAANPPEGSQRHALESEPVLVDNTPPLLQGLSVTGRRLKVRVVDGLGPIARVEVALNGKTDFRPVGAADGLFDTADEQVDADLSSLLPSGPAIVAVRAFDLAGNAVVQEIEAK